MASKVPSVKSTKETTNYARLCRLLIEVGSHALRKVLHNQIKGSLHKTLSKYKSKLQGLKSKKIITPIQWNALFPLMPSSMSSENFDITLLVLLLRNICGFTPPATGWDAFPPLSTDHSYQADIVRLRHFRNTVYAHVEKASVDDATFNTQWHDIGKVLVRLGGADYQAAITQLETETMDPDIEEHYKDLLEQWRKDDINIKDQLCEIQNKMGNVLKELVDLKEKVKQPKGKSV